MENGERGYDVPTLTGSGVVLRGHREADLARIVEAGSDDRIGHWLPDLPRPYTLAEAQTFLESRREQVASGRGVSWAVADPGSDALLANISLFDIKPAEDAEIGYWTHPGARGRGVMTEACGLVVRHAFIPRDDGGLGLRRLRVVHAEGNTASRQVVVRNGFVETGRDRAASRLGDGSRVDTIRYDLLAEEYSGARN